VAQLLIHVHAPVGSSLLALLLAMALPGCGSARGGAQALAEPVSAASPAGPYAVTRRVGAWVFVAGQIARDPGTGAWRYPGDIDGQTRLVLDNLKTALAAEGATMADVVKTTVLLHSAVDMPAMNAIYQSYFSQNPLPVRTTIPGVDFGAAPILIEIDAIAFVGTAAKPTAR
jgi:2-iminobutanoate/2-iminopropanoate deaminase